MDTTQKFHIAAQCMRSGLQPNWEAQRSPCRLPLAAPGPRPNTVQRRRRKHFREE